MEKAKGTAKKSAPKPKKTVIAAPAEEMKKIIAQDATDYRHIVRWGDEKNTLPYYLL